MLSTGTAPVIIEALSGTAAAPVQPAPSAASAAPVALAAPAPERAPVAAAGRQTPAIPAIYIIGGMPPAGSAKIYRLQVGAYKIPRNAADALEKLKSAGLNPAYEKNDDLYRVVLPGLMAEDILPVSEKLKTSGFTQAIIREE
jgi:rare lipoprotein A